MVKKSITLEDLAIMVKHGFDEVHERLDVTNTRLDATNTRVEAINTRLDATNERLNTTATKKDMEEGFFAVNRRLDLLHEDISDLPAIREELKDHDERLVHVERKVGSRK